MYCPAETPGDRSREDVVEHERRDAQLGERSAQRLLDHAVDSAAGKHGAAFDIHGAHSEGEEHDAEDEPRRGLADSLFSDASGVKGR